jgi:hypothetical protein
MILLYRMSVRLNHIVSVANATSLIGSCRPLAMVIVDIPASTSEALG